MSTGLHRYVTATDGQRLAVYSAGDTARPTRLPPPPSMTSEIPALADVLAG